MAIKHTGISYYGWNYAEHAACDFAEMKEHGCDTVILAITEFDMDFWFPNLNNIVKEAHKLGLRVLADLWGIGKFFGGEQVSLFLQNNINHRQVSAMTGESLPAACFTSNAFRDYFNRLCVKIARDTEVDGFFWDEPHYALPNALLHGDGHDWSCRCPECMKKFADYYGYEMPKIINDDVKEFRWREALFTLGKIKSIQINNTTVCVLPVISPWVTDPKESYGKKVQLKDGMDCYRGGCLSDHPHAFDLARYFTDSDFESIYAEVSPSIRKDLSVEESVFVLGKMKNGVVVNIDPSYSRHENENPPVVPEGLGFEGYPKRVEVDVIINGEKGSIVADCFHTGVYYVGLPYHTYAFYYASGNAHYTPSLDEFANAVNEHRSPFVSLDVHRNTMEAVNACYESISLGKPVKL